jgi:superfamily II DNA or RNA helicase
MRRIARGLPVRDEVSAPNPEPTGPWHAIELRPYQQAAALSWELARRKGIVVLPTGSGKTRVALAAMAQTRSRALCLVPTRVLLEQWLGELRAVHRGPVGCLGDGERRLEAVTVATFESAYRHMPSIGREFDLLVVDEVHHFGVGIRDEALGMSVAPFRLGLTATPPDGPVVARLEQLIGPVVYRLGVGDLAGTWLADFDLVVLQLGMNKEERECYGADHRIFSEVNLRFRAADGKVYQVEYFNLDVIISVGYRVKSHRGTRFRIWASLREYAQGSRARGDGRRWCRRNGAESSGRAVSGRRSKGAPLRPRVL